MYLQKIPAYSISSYYTTNLLLRDICSRGGDSFVNIAKNQALFLYNMPKLSVFLDQKALAEINIKDQKYQRMEFQIEPE